MSYTGTPKTWVAGAIVGAADMNAEIRDVFNGIINSWPTYTPTLSGFTLGNGTVAGRWNQVGKTIDFAALFTFGSTSAAATATPTLTLPTAALSANFGTFKCILIDSSPGNIYNALAYQSATGTIGAWITGTSGLGAIPTTTTPFTWATGDSIYFSGRYESV